MPETQTNSHHQTIPVANLEDFLSGDPVRRRHFVSTVGEALKDIGFFALENHGVDHGLIENAYGLAHRFFELPTTGKCQYEKAEWRGQRGYVSFGREHAKDSKAPDLKEFWHVGRETWKQLDAPGMHQMANVWPVEIPGFKPAMLDLYRSMERCAQSILEACAEYLGEPVDRFTRIAEDGDTILRVIHYPPVADDVNPDSVRAAAHEDINLITLLMEATAGGLELLQRDGSWRPIRAVKGQIIVDTGDMMQNITNGVLRSTTHRVVNPDNSRERRFSMPFFVHPRGDASLNPLDGCVARQNGKKLYPDVTAGQYLTQRLKEIGLG